MKCNTGMKWFTCCIQSSLHLWASNLAEVSHIYTCCSCLAFVDVIDINLEEQAIKSLTLWQIIRDFFLIPVIF